jgi:hypothetical protein
MRELHMLAEAREREKPWGDGPGLPQRGFFCSIFEQPKYPCMWQRVAARGPSHGQVVRQYPARR